MKVNNYPVKSPSTGDRLFGSDSNGDQKQFDMYAVSSNVFQYQIGEYVADEGGIIFHKYLDGDTQKYLVVSITDQSIEQAWSNISGTLIGSSAQSTWDGLSNSNAIVGQSGFTNGAAKLCLDLVSLGKDDWYLPAIDELSLLWQNRFNVNNTISSIGGATIVSQNTYWSSTENMTSIGSFAYAINFLTIASGNFSKTELNYVRAIRKFSI